MRKYDKSKEIRISQYTDDMQIYLSDDKQIPKALNIIKEFSKMAGPKLNVDKTEGDLDQITKHMNTSMASTLKLNP